MTLAEIKADLDRIERAFLEARVALAEAAEEDDCIDEGCGEDEPDDEDDNEED